MTKNGLGISAEEMVEQLSLRNRAYNLLYAFGESPLTVQTLSPREAKRIVEMAQSAFRGDEGTFQSFIRKGMKPYQLRYVATGRIGREGIDNA